MKNNLNTYKLKLGTLIISFSGMFMACTGKKIEKLEQDINKINTELNNAKNKLDKLHNDSITLVIDIQDSLLASNKTYQNLKRVRNEEYEIRNDINTYKEYLKKPNMYLLSKQVNENAIIVANKYKNKIKNYLQQYQINSDITEKMFEKYEIIDDWIFSDTTYHDDSKNECLKILKEKLDFDNQFGDMRKNEIIKKIDQIFDDLSQELYKDRKNIEKQYAQFYPRLSDKYQKSHPEFNFPLCETGEMVEWNYFSCPSGNEYIYRTISVYDQNLSPDWFNIPGAKYTLESCGKNKWKVKRTINKGKTETKQFTDPAVWRTSLRDEISKTKNFEAIAGKNKGVRINYSKLIESYEAKKEDKISPEKQKILTDNFSALQDKLQKSITAGEKSDSIYAATRNTAKKLTNKRLGAKLDEARKTIKEIQSKLSNYEAELCSLKNR